MNPVADWPRYAPLLTLGISATLLLSAYMFQHIGGLAPCELCVYQRYPHYAAMVLALPAVLLRSRLGTLFLAAAGLALLVGLGVAIYHVGVEQGWFQSACATAITGGSIEDLRAQLMEAPLVRCDEVPWSLWGISMAGWNGIVSLVLGGFSLYAAYRLWLMRATP